MEPLLRCLLAFFITWYILKKAYRRKSLSYSGCIAAFFVGTIVSYSNLCHLTSLLTFFYASNKATRFRQHLKVKLDDDFKFDGQRNAYQVISNGFFATFFSYFYIIECGYGERPIDFEHDYKATWYSIAVLSSLCCMCGDTFSSELGPVLGSKNNIISPTSDQVFHIIKFKRVPKGTNGGISFLGTLASFYGGLLVGLAYYLTLKVCLFLSGTNFGISSNIPQWPIILIGALSGLVGSLIDSVLGGYFQYSGINKKTRAIVSEPDPPQVEHISGYNLLSNNQVNFFSCLLISLLAPYFAFKFYKNYVLPI